MMTIGATRNGSWPGNVVPADELRSPEFSGVHAGRAVAGALCLAAAGLLLAGCAPSRHGEGRLASERSVSRGDTPWILTGPAGMLLTNAGGFVAHVRVTENGVPDGSSPALSGELFCRQAQLYLVPEATHSASRHQARDALSFIWDVSQDRGFALSESLQGCAPITSSQRHTNVAVIETDSRSSPPARIEGHRCVLERVTVVSSDGTTNLFEAWRAPDLEDVRLKIVSLAGTAPFTVQLSSVRLGSPPPDIFAPPAGFTSYPSLEAMLNELAQREQALGHHPEGEDREPSPNAGQGRGHRRAPPTGE